MRSFVVAQINARNASGNLKMAIGTAWIQMNLRKVAKRYGGVLLIDDIEVKNEEESPFKQYL